MRPVKAPVALLMMAACALGQVAGTVRDSTSGLPVEGVKITLAGTGAKFVESSPTGSFLLEGVPPGRHPVYFRRDGYEDGKANVDVTADGADVTLRIKPYAVMEGVVSGEDGNPLEGVRVYVGGLRDSTGRDGRYHAQDIAAGTYTVTLRLPYELRRRTVVRDETSGETFGYGYTVYYPGLADQKLAAPLTIAPGAHFTNFDIRLRRTRLVEMKGKVVDAPADTEVELDSASGLPEGTYGKRRIDKDQGFRFELLEPGDYTVVVHRNRPGDDLPYLAPVHLGEAGVQDLEVVLPPFARIEGTVRTARADLRWDGTLRVMLNRLGYETEIRVGPEGRFTLNAVPPGTWNLAIDANLAHGASDPARKIYVSLAPARSLRVTESGNPPLEITLTDEAGHITGTADEPGVVAVMPPSGSSLSSSRMAMVKGDGSFALDVPPGEYRVFMAGGPECTKLAELVTVQGGASVNVHLKACGAEGN